MKLEVESFDTIATKIDELKEHFDQKFDAKFDSLKNSISAISLRVDNIECLIKSHRLEQRIDSPLPIGFPLKTVEEMNELEEFLKDPEYFAKLLEQMRRINGSGQQHTIACKKLCDFMFTK